MLSGPIYRTGSIGWAKAGHGLAHTGFDFVDHRWDLLLAENGTCRHHALIGESPQRNQEPSGERHDPDSSGSFAAARKPFLKPKTELALWLVSKPAPRDLDRHRADAGITGFVDSLLTSH